ncbi:MAG: hypothetical protein AB1512_27255 [Thermodesulfobacteriota bacterium]
MKSRTRMARPQARIVAVFLILALAWTGCARDPVARDLAEYVNRGVLGIAELERVSLEKYAAVTGTNYTTDKRFYDALRDDVVPLYKRFLDGLRRLRPETEEVRQLHNVYIRAAVSLYEGFREMMVGLEQQDVNIVRAANRKIEKGRAENERWRKELTALTGKHGLKFEQMK